MQDLKVIGVESGALLVATDAGGEYRLPVTTSLHSQLRAANPDATPREKKISPREVQASIRAGKSAEEVASSTGADLDYVRRFEGPVMAEREYVLSSVRAVSVSVGADATPATDDTRFGDVIDSRLEASEATDVSWSAYKDAESGWVAHVTYVAQEVDRAATWRFDTKKSTLAPLDGDAHTLSRQGNDPAPLVPRLRAVGHDASESGRFDSGAFEVDVVVDEVVFERPDLERHRFDSRSPASVAATNRAPEAATDHNQTADLLEALRRRRGEREAARFDDPDDAKNAHPATGSLRVIDVPLDDFDAPERDIDTKPIDTPNPVARHPASGRSAPSSPATGSPRARKGRASMPSWDEIVFGARSDDDPA